MVTADLEGKDNPSTAIGTMTTAILELLMDWMEQFIGRLVDRLTRMVLGE